jgi:hypothetical protein
MRFSRSSVRVAALACVAASCRGNSAGPNGQNVVSGRFGSGGAEMQVTPTFIYFQVRCDTFNAKPPLVTDADGRFVLTLVPRPGNASRHATLHGTVVGGRITGSVEIVFPTFVRTDSIAIVRGVRPGYQNLSCAMP